MRFYLGTHEPGWLARVDVALFVSHRRRRALACAAVQQLARFGATP